MKTKLIKLQDKFILVSDEEIKEGDWIIDTLSMEIVCWWDGNNFDKYDKKIIAGIPELPSIDFSLLSEADCKEIGWVDVEKLADENGNNYAHSYNPEIFIEGFKTAQSLNDKMFSLEDMKKAFIAGGNSQIEEDDDYGTEYEAYMDKWFEQFKKK